MRRLLTLFLALMASSMSWAGDAAHMRYPLVLVHGLSGFESILGISYFYRIPDALRREGATVYVARVNPAQSTEFRGEELVYQLKQWAARDGVAKFNLMGHSHGGPTVRYAANVVPQLVASASSIAGAHFGTPLADFGGPLNLPLGLSDTAITPIMKLLAFLTGSPSPDSASLPLAAEALSTAGAAAFNRRFPSGEPTTACGQGPEKTKIAGQEIRWYSYSGTSRITNPFDVSDALLSITGLYLTADQNDGALPRCASHWGRVVRDDYPWNHLDEINQVLGVVGPLSPSPVAFYIAHANRLKVAGL